MDKKIITIIPSFVLRVDPFNIAEKYLNNNYSKLKKIKQELKIKVTNEINFVSTNADSIEGPVYVFKDKNSNPHTLIFSNQQDYSNFLTNKKEENYTCQLCLREFKHEPERIPLSIDERYITDPDDYEIKIDAKLVWS